jgi:hypothetical protein
MPFLVEVIQADMRSILLDASSTTYSNADLYGWMWEAYSATVLAKPDACTEVVTTSLVAGVAQRLAAHTAVLDIFCNAASGKPITLVDRALLEVTDPTWFSQAQATDIVHWTYDPRSPLDFMVYPPASSSAQITGRFAFVPPVPETGDSFALSDAWVMPVKSFALHRAYAVNTKKQDIAKSQFYYEQWAQAVGLSDKKIPFISPTIADGTPV